MLKKLKQVWKQRNEYIAWTRKALINATGLAGSLLALGLLHGKTADIAATVIGVLTVFAHFQVSNGPAPVAAEDPPAG